jgi:hypothetical protein
VHYAFSAGNAVSGVAMVRHVIYGALVGRFIMKLAERFTMSFGKFGPAQIEPCALMMRYGNADIWCAVVRNDIIASRVCDYLERNHPDIAPNFYIDCKFFDSSREMMGKSFTEQFRSGDIQNIKIFAARTPLLAYFPLQKAMFSLPPIKATH